VHDSAAATAPRAAIDRFLEFYFEEYGSVCLTRRSASTLRPLLTDDLNEALADAVEAERCDKNRRKGRNRHWFRATSSAHSSRKPLRPLASTRALRKDSS